MNAKCNGRERYPGLAFCEVIGELLASKAGLIPIRRKMDI